MGNSPIIWAGTKAKSLKAAIQLLDQATIYSGSVNPSSVATVGVAGDIYLSTSAANIFIKTDSGTTTNWSAFSTSITYTEGSIAFSDSSGNLTQDNSNFFWDNSNNRLGIKTNTPSVELDVVGDAAISGSLTASNVSGTNTGDVTLGTANGLSLTGQALSLGLASSSTTGALSATDWNTFNSAAGGGITELTSDVTGSGPGSTATTVAAIQGTTVAGVTGTGNVVFDNSPSGAVQLGNLGLGTAASGYALEVTGGTGSTGWGNTQLFLHSGGTEAGINLSNTDTGGRTYTIISASNASGAGGGTFSIGDSLAGMPRLLINSSGYIGIGGAVAPQNSLQIGTLIGASTSTPSTLSLGATYSDTHGANPKLKIYDDGTSNVYGLGVSEGSLDVMAPLNAAITFYSNGSSSAQLAISSTGTVNVPILTASQVVATDSSKNLTSIAYASTNTASSLVRRDGSGNFSAGTITASLTGHASLDVATSSLGNLTGDTTAKITVTGGTGAVVGSVAISQHVADTSNNGYLSSTDWNTFNNKQSTLAFSESVSESGGTVTLAGDTATPGNNKYYGTNASGTRGYYSTAIEANGSAGTPVTITDAGITAANVRRQIFVTQSDGGAVSITANPQISPGTLVGDEMFIIGDSSSDYIIFEDGSGLSLNGDAYITSNASLHLMWNGNVWYEISRR